MSCKEIGWIKEDAKPGEERRKDYIFKLPKKMKNENQDIISESCIRNNQGKLVTTERSAQGLEGPLQQPPQHWGPLGIKILSRIRTSIRSGKVINRRHGL